MPPRGVPAARSRRSHARSLGVACDWTFRPEIRNSRSGRRPDSIPVSVSVTDPFEHVADFPSSLAKVQRYRGLPETRLAMRRGSSAHENAMCVNSGTRKKVKCVVSAISGSWVDVSGVCRILHRISRTQHINSLSTSLSFKSRQIKYKKLDQNHAACDPLHAVGASGPAAAREPAAVTG